MNPSTYTFELFYEKGGHTKLFHEKGGHAKTISRKGRPSRTEASDGQVYVGNGAIRYLNARPPFTIGTSKITSTVSACIYFRIRTGHTTYCLHGMADYAANYVNLPPPVRARAWRGVGYPHNLGYNMSIRRHGALFSKKDDHWPPFSL